ncbi:VOC family protein [Luteibaculum oceani]|uniref:VOC family protein n=1 Tax=Luteibaculum oceani TaxID=1294296 RepID=A0A5C6VII4_9FLAO|nr:VOC family protein [Luteibaculum oceani]TXC85372.1 VOC family protein [Luteibaculum oceani]
MSNGRVIGVGGVFFVSEDPKALYQWYEENLGLVNNGYGFLFERSDKASDRGYLQFSAFSNNDYIKPSPKNFMINFRVDNLDVLLEKLATKGIHPCKEPESFEYGKFAHILDPENNKIELWEPVDEVMKTYDDGKNVNRP